MKIAVIGAGKVGSALARGWSRAGESILLGVRDPANAGSRALADDLGVTLLTPAAAAAGADVIVLALPWGAAEGAVKSLGDLSGKIVIDCMNPLGMVDGALGLLVGFNTSGAEILAGWATGARIVKALNQVGAEMMEQAATLDGRPVMFLAGDDDGAKQVVAKLVEILGFEALDAGRLRQARILEPLAMVWINQALMRGKGRDWAFGALRTRE